MEFTEYIQKKEELLNSFPNKKEAHEQFKTNVTFRTCIESLVRGGDIKDLLLQVCVANNNTIISFQNYIKEDMRPFLFKPDDVIGLSNKTNPTP